MNEVKLVLVFIGAVLLAVFVWAPVSLYEKLWQAAKDVGFFKTKKR